MAGLDIDSVFIHPDQLSCLSGEPMSDEDINNFIKALSDSTSDAEGHATPGAPPVVHTQEIPEPLEYLSSEFSDMSSPEAAPASPCYAPPPNGFSEGSYRMLAINQKRAILTMSHIALENLFVQVTAICVTKAYAKHAYMYALPLDNCNEEKMNALLEGQSFDTPVHLSKISTILAESTSLRNDAFEPHMMALDSVIVYFRVNDP